VRASVTKDVEHSFRGRKAFATQNVLAGWEGTAHDALVLADAIERERGLQVSEGNK
jgi:hypothetical protein